MLTWLQSLHNRQVVNTSTATVIFQDLKLAAFLYPGSHLANDDRTSCEPVPTTMIVAIVVPLILLVMLFAVGVVLYRCRKRAYFRMTSSWDHSEDIYM